MKEKGMCPPLNDRDFFNLFRGLEDIIIKFYPELEKYLK